MSQLTATAPTEAPAVRDRDGADHPDTLRSPERPRFWALIEALAYAGAYVDPSGMLALQRLRRAEQEEAERRERS